MTVSNAAYCVECNSIIMKDAAFKVFRTGFYNRSIPLALCDKCACVNVQESGMIVASEAELAMDAFLAGGKLR